jgi:hypothetical protein
MCGRSGQANNLAPFKPMLFKLFWPRRELANFFLGRQSKLRFIFREVLSLTHENFEEQIRYSSLLSSLIIIYFNYYSIYYNDRIFEVFGMKENREAAEALTYYSTF